MIFAAILVILALLLRGILSHYRISLPIIFKKNRDKLVHWTMFILAIILLCSGRWLLGIMLLLVNFAFVIRKSAVRIILETPDSYHQTRLKSSSLEIVFGNKVGSLNGFILAGPLAGKSLNDLTLTQCLQLYQLLQQSDQSGARLLKLYLDRRVAGWAGASQSDGDPWGPGRAGKNARWQQRSRDPQAEISHEEAWQVLELKSGASRDQIIASHRRMMKRWHPDRGGDHAMAARLNGAKELLLRDL